MKEMGNAGTPSEKEVYRYLGYREEQHNLTDEMKQLVKDCMEEIQKMKNVKARYSEPVKLTRAEGKIYADSLLMEGKDIEAHLENCDEVVFMAVTLGMQVDTLIRRAEVMDMAKAVILDSAANVAVEEEADRVEQELRALAKSKGKYLTMRFSPGYGDFPITFQKQLLNYLDAPRKIGLSAAPSQMMTPGKSVTAILGLAKVEVTGKRAGCKTCAMREKCLYRKRGTTCEAE